jgi:LPXTG-site transpeptidase (sortase) family protein
VPVTPTRLLDTREGGALNPLSDQFQPRSKKPHSGWTVEVPVLGRAGVPAGAGAVALSVTLTSSEAAGFVTAYPARTTRPLASSVNTSTPGNTVANHAIVPVSAAGVSLFTLGGAHLVTDLMGWFTGSPTPMTTGPAANPPSPGLQFPAILTVPRFGAVGAPSVMTCSSDTRDVSLATGPGHLTGTSSPGAPSNTAIFGHRTTHTAPFFFLDQMQIGDLIELATIGGVARYSVEAVRSIVSPADETIYFLGSERPTITLIACTPPHSVRYRIVVQGVLFDCIEY